MLFTDNSSKQKLVILNNDGTLEKKITCSPHHSRDVTLIDDSTLAVSTAGDIRIINIESLIECKVGGSTTDIICSCLFFSVLRTAVCEPVSMATDPNVVIVDTKSKM
jgi:hypothetical protein